MKYARNLTKIHLRITGIPLPFLCALQDCLISSSQAFGENPAITPITYRGGTEAWKELSQGDKALSEIKFKPCFSHHVTLFPNIAHMIPSPEGYKKK